MIFIFLGGFTYQTKGLKFVNCSKRVEWTGWGKEIIHDLDGSLWNLPDSMAAQYFDINAWSNDCYRAKPEYGNTMICSNKTRIRKQLITDITPSTLIGSDLSVKVGNLSTTFIMTQDYVFPTINLGVHYIMM